MEAGELSRQIQANAMTRDRWVGCIAVKALKNSHRLRDFVAGVGDSHHDIFPILLSAYLHSPAGPVVLASVFEKILHDERSVTVFARDEQIGGKFLVDPDFW